MVQLSDIEQQILWGMSSVTQELRNNYSGIIRANFNVDPDELEDISRSELESLASGTGWTERELKHLLEERQHIEELHEFLDSILNGGSGIDHDTVVKIVEEDRRAERIEEMLGSKYESGNLEMGGKNTVKLTKALTEFSKCLKAFVDGSSVKTEKISNPKSIERLEKWEPVRKVSGKNGRYLFGGLQLRGDLSFDEKFYSKADYIVLDSLDFEYRNRGFREFIRTQPKSGRFNYEELVAENVFRDQLPVIIPDVMPISSYRGINLDILDDYAAKAQGAAAIPGNFGLPVLGSMALNGTLPPVPVFAGIITWKLVFMVGIPAALLPRLLTGVAARMALVCEKLETGVAGKTSGKPSFLLYTNKKEMALVAAFVKNPELRKKVLEVHSIFGFGGLEKEYLDYMEEIGFPGFADIKHAPSEADKLKLSYKGETRMVRYHETGIDTEVTADITAGSGKKVSGLKDRIMNFF